MTDATADALLANTTADLRARLASEQAGLATELYWLDSVQREVDQGLLEVNSRQDAIRELTDLIADLDRLTKRRPLRALVADEPEGAA